MLGKWLKKRHKMRIEQLKTKKQLFICINKRDNGGCCSSKGSEQIIIDLKSRLKQMDKWYLFKVTKSGCLGGCDEGINAVLYPVGQRIEKITINDSEELLSLILKE